MTGCFDTPKNTLNEFIRAIHQKDSDAFLDALDTPSRDFVLKELHLAKARAALEGDAQRAEADLEQMLSDQLASLKGIEEMRELKRHDSEALLEVVDFEGQTQTYRLVQEKGEWKLSLLQAPVHASASP